MRQSHISKGAGNRARLRRGPRQPGQRFAQPGPTGPRVETSAEGRRTLARGRDARNNLGVVLATQGRFDEASAVPTGVANPARLRRGAEESGLAAGDLPGGVAAKRRGSDRACPAGRPVLRRQAGGRADVLAAAYAEAERFPEALTTARKALELATQQKARALAEVLRTRIAFYEAGKPYREMPSASPPAPSKP